MHIDETHGWFGGTILDLAIKNEVVLAATLGGLHRSRDGGHSWQRVGSNLPDAFTQAVALSTDNDSNLAIAASNAGWLYISHDRGETWEIVDSWRNIGSITRVALSPNVRTDGIILVCGGENGIYKSADYGRTWKAANFGLLNLSVLSISFAPTFALDEVILAGTDHGGLFRSRNAARAWRESGQGLPEATIQSIAFSPAFSEDGTVFAGLDEGGLYRSTDKARSWELVPGALTQESINSIVLDENWATGGRMLVATDGGIWISTDAATTWQLVDERIINVYTMTKSENILLAGTYMHGVYASSDGRTWHTSNDKLAAHLPPLAAFSGAFEDDHRLFMASADGELARTEDAGRTWTSLLPRLSTSDITILESAGAGTALTLFAVTGETVNCSQDGGETWTPLLDAGTRITALSTSDAYAVDGKLLIGTRQGQVMLSNDKGVTWQQAYTYSGEAVIAVACSEQDMIYAVTAKPLDTAVWQMTLRECESGKTLSVHKAPRPTAVLHYSQHSEMLTCALGSHVVCVNDSAIVAESELPNATPVACFAVDGKLLFAGTRAGLFVAGDNGQSWTSAAPDGAIVALHVAAPGQVYAIEMGGKLHSVQL